MALLILPKGWHRVSEQKQMCHLCGGNLFLFCLYAAKFLLSFCRLFLSFYNERQRFAAWRSGGIRSAYFQFSTNVNLKPNVQFSTKPVILPNCCYAVVVTSSAYLIISSSSKSKSVKASFILSNLPLLSMFPSITYVSFN